MKSKAEQADPGVIQVYRVKHRQQHNKIKNMLPIILKVRLKKGAEPVLVNYSTMRERYTNMLLDYYERKVLLRPAGDKAYFPVHPDCEQDYIEPKEPLQQVKLEELQPLRKRPNKDSRDSRDVRDSREPKTVKEVKNPQSIVNREEKEYRQYKEHRERDNRDTKALTEHRQDKEQLDNKEVKQEDNRGEQWDNRENRENRDHSREPRESREGRELRRSRQKQGHSLSTETRPKRSCRLRSEYSKDYDNRQEHNYNNEVQQIREKAEQKQSSEEEDHTQPELKKILDYDHLSEIEGRHNLISPAVIPSIRLKPEHPMAPPIIPYPMPRMNFQEMEKDQESPEFKESEESEFLLDDRGKQKRKKEKMLREQERLNRKKKSRRIKKRPKTNHSKH